MTDYRQHRPDSKARLGVAAILITSLAITAIVYEMTRRAGTRSIQQDLEHAVDNQAASLGRELDILLEVLYSSRDFFYGSESVEREEFAQFVGRKLRQYASIQALEWVPAVPESERTDFVNRVRASGFPNFEITEQRSRKMLPAATRSMFYPVLYIEPLAGNEQAMGFDLASDAIRFETLSRSRTSGQVLATPAITLVQETDHQKGTLVFVPVYYQDSSDGGSRRHRGFVVGVFRIGDILETALAYLPNQSRDIDISLYDATDATDPSESILLHNRRPAVDSAADKRYHYSRRIWVAGRTWRISGTATELFVATRQSPFPLVVLIFGCLFSMMLTIFVKDRIDQLVMLRRHNRVIVETVANGIIATDANGRISLLNPDAERIFGYAESDVRGRSLSLLVPDLVVNPRGELADRRRKGLDGDIVGRRCDMTGRDRKGRAFPIALTVTEVEVDSVYRFIAIIRDITEEKQMKQALIETKERAEESSRLKTEFLNTISHELRTPLTVILGNISLLTDTTELPPNPEEIAAIAQDIERSGEMLLTLINELLDLSRIEAGRMTLHREKLLSTNVIDEAVEVVKSLAETKGLHMVSNVEPFYCSADPVRLKQVLLNLLGNAIKFTESGVITVGGRERNDGVEFFVEDTGCGIEKADLKCIFDPFRQVDGTATRSAGGSGLGLAITSKLVGMHGGRIDVNSARGEGTRFTIALPQV